MLRYHLSIKIPAPYTLSLVFVCRWITGRIQMTFLWTRNLWLYQRGRAKKKKIKFCIWFLLCLVFLFFFLLLIMERNWQRVTNQKVKFMEGRLTIDMMAIWARLSPRVHHHILVLFQLKSTVSDGPFKLTRNRPERRRVTTRQQQHRFEPTGTHVNPW